MLPDVGVSVLSQHLVIINTVLESIMFGCEGDGKIHNWLCYWSVAAGHHLLQLFSSCLTAVQLNCIPCLASSVTLLLDAI